jgi:ribosomal protein S18 acetylase RimI-like enzyme
MAELRSLDPSPVQVAAVRAVVGAAFADDPMLRWVFGAVEQPEQASAAWLGLFIDAFAGGGVVDVAVVDEQVVGAALWRVDQSPLPYPELPTLGGLLVSFLGAQRATEVAAGLGAFAANKPDPPFHYLQFLAVHPRCQGQGLGRLLVAHGQERASRNGQGVYLESTNPRNLPFYRSVGFTTVGEFPLLPDGPTAWRQWWAP